MVQTVGKILWQSIEVLNFEEINKSLEKQVAEYLLATARQNDFADYKEHTHSIEAYNDAIEYLDDIRQHLDWLGRDDERFSDMDMAAALLRWQKAVRRFDEEYNRHMDEIIAENIWKNKKAALAEQGIDMQDYCRKNCRQYKCKAVLYFIILAAAGLWCAGWCVFSPKLTGTPSLMLVFGIFSFAVAYPEFKENKSEADRWKQKIIKEYGDFK